MKHLVCSKMWTDINISIPKMEFRNCCKRDIQIISIEEIRELGPDVFVKNKNLMKDKKFFIEENQLPEKCNYCKDSWPNSIWNNWNLWKDKDWSEIELQKLIYEDKTDYIELMLSTTCNQTCMYCTWEVSSLWANIKKKPVVINHEWKIEVLKALYQYIKKYHTGNNKNKLTYNFLGGEPFLDLEIFDVMSNILNIHRENYTPGKKIDINITSNLNVKPKTIEKYLELVKNNQDFRWTLSASIDAIGDIGKELRDGLDIERFQNNLEKILSSNLVDFVDVLPSVTSISLPEFPSLIRWIKSIMHKYNLLHHHGSRWSIGINTVTWPQGLNPGTLELSYRSYIDDCFEEIEDLPENYQKQQLKIHFENLRQMIGSKRNEADKEEVKRFFSEHSEIKNKDYNKIFPILKEITK